MTKILVVEDGALLRSDIVEMLAMEGYTVFEAENGKIGLELAQQHRPDLIICDVMMPEMNGYAMLEALRKIPDMAPTPFIFLTARADRTDYRQGMELGADDYVTKPFTIPELMNAVRARLAREEQREEKAETRLNTLRDSIVLALPHELRTPLTGILGFSDILKLDYETMEREQVGMIAEHISKSGMRLLRLVEEHLIYAQIEVMKGDPERIEALRRRSTPNPKSVIEAQAIVQAQKVRRENDLKLSVEVDRAVCMLDSYLDKIVAELVDNAFKFSDAGTPVTVAGAAAADSSYLIEVHDNGHGLTPQQIEQIGAYMQFERRIYEQQGVGLGLTIAKRLVELHGGSLMISSIPYHGTTVRVSLPCTANA